MIDFEKTAQEITEFVSNVIPFPISITDENGTIIGSTDPSRLNTTHPDAQKIFKTKSFLSYEYEDVKKLENVQPGISAPLFFKNEFIGIIGIIGSPNEVQPYAKLIKQYVEFIWQQSHMNELKSLTNKMEEIYLQYILQFENANLEKIIEYSQALHIEPEKNMTCILIDFKTFIKSEIRNNHILLSEEKIKEFIFKKMQTYFKTINIDKISFMNTEYLVIILSFSDTKQYKSFSKDFVTNGNKLINDLKSLQITGVTMACGQLVHTVCNLRYAYEEAHNILKSRIASKINKSVFSLSDWDTASALLQENINHDYLEKIANTYIAHNKNNQLVDLKRSFIIYCENHMNVSQASKALFIHRNTLIYRLEKIEEIFNINIKNFQHCVLFYFVLTSNII